MLSQNTAQNVKTMLKSKNADDAKIAANLVWNELGFFNQDEHLPVYEEWLFDDEILEQSFEEFLQELAILHLEHKKEQSEKKESETN